MENPINHQLFKFRYPSGKFVTKFFSNKKKLYRFIKRTNPSDVWHSLNYFNWFKDMRLNKNKKKEKIGIMIERRSCVDLDDTTKENALEVLKRISDLPIEYLLHTSKFSIQIVIKGDYDKKIRKRLKGLDYCKSTLSGDDNLVIRMPETKHNSGFMTKYLNYKLDGFEGIKEPKNSPNKPKNSKIYYYRYIKNKIQGVRDRKILFYKSNYLGYKRVKYLQKELNFGDCFLVDFGEKEKERYGFIFPCAEQNSKVDKITKKNLHIRISAKRCGKIKYSEKPKLIKVIESKKNGAFSFSVMEWLRSLGAEKRYDVEIGKDRIFHAKSRG